MPDPGQHKPTVPDGAVDQSLSQDMLDWAETFVRLLQIEFVDLAGKDNEAASTDQQRRWMMTAFLRTLVESGASPQDIDQLYLAHVSAIERNDDGPWSEVKNLRRIELIDRSLQGQLTFDESKELARLTHQLRETYDNEQLVPMEGAVQLHKQLLDLDAKRREQK